jgi:hypothetical protein
MENAGLGPGVEALLSTADTFEADEELSGVGMGGGGGSITEGAGDGCETGSGSGGRASSVEEVSIVMCFVLGGFCRRVKRMGQHLTPTEGFLCPGR